nr:immunoglobulin heavy chain junction region [Macaca mulatta]MOW45608.1 immunoglobulin heavy chain junction region [Macaca mulatta]MOW45617.1 immunoglobulin heavy chain junction region [Macaca mulatta]MOW45918.1 immunoglobulin heavy chain junction region [Macaca mulatta]MOW45961.1 immunoglobulin heavy chain junction region [Macaca mulatta]
CVKGIVSW